MSEEQDIVLMGCADAVSTCSLCKKAYSYEDFKKLPAPRKGGTQVYGDELYVFRNCTCHDPPTTLCVNDVDVFERLPLEHTEAHAKRLATLAHGDQKYGAEPYTAHLRAVREVLRNFGIAGELGVAAWLHDTLEDTSVVSNTLRTTYGKRVTDLVVAVTGYGETRAERNANAYAKMKLYPQAVKLKLADRIANVEASRKSASQIFLMYRKEHAGFREALLPLLDEEKSNHMWARLERAWEV